MRPNSLLKAMFNNEHLFLASARPNPYKLCRGDFHTLRFEDYGALLEEAKGKKRVLEFGPGCSTWAFIEAGCEEIVTAEYQDDFLQSAKEQFKDYPQVKVVRFWDEPEARSEAQGEFDLALVDSPKGYKFVQGVTPNGSRKRHPGQEDCSRLNTCLLALQHAPIVLLHDANRPLERGTLCRLSSLGHKSTFIPGTRAGLARIERGENTRAVS
jgi:hypothetical protein